jgi:hypothetical protein
LWSLWLELLEIPRVSAQALFSVLLAGQFRAQKMRDYVVFWVTGYWKSDPISGDPTQLSFGWFETEEDAKNWGITVQNPDEWITINKCWLELNKEKLLSYLQGHLNPFISASETYPGLEFEESPRSTGINSLTEIPA